jgi:low affinity Fe/Cu permease
MNSPTWYGHFTKNFAKLTGKSITFIFAILLIMFWLISGPLFDFSDTWQLAINTTTTIITFIMVFVIQNTQNRDTEAMQVKLDELIRVSKNAHNILLDLEEQDDEQIDISREKYINLAKLARKKSEN